MNVGDFKFKVGDMITASSYDKPEDRSYQGDVLEVVAISLPFVALKVHASKYGGLSEGSRSLDIRRYDFVSLSREYCDAMSKK